MTPEQKSNSAMTITIKLSDVSTPTRLAYYTVSQHPLLEPSDQVSAESFPVRTDVTQTRGLYFHPEHEINRGCQQISCVTTADRNSHGLQTVTFTELLLLNATCVQLSVCRDARGSP